MDLAFIFIVFICIIIFFMFTYFVPVGLWITAIFSGVPVGIGALIGMRFRKVPPAVIVGGMINATKAGLTIDRNELEAHYLAGGNVQKVINGEGEYIEEGGDNKLISKGLIKNFAKEGAWIGEIKDKKVSFTEEYKNGKLEVGHSIDSLSNKFTYTEIEERAHPKKGIKDFYNYVQNCGIIPKNIEGGVYGQILLSLEVTETGKLENITAYADDKFGVTANAIQLISQYENWIPGKHRGITVKTHFTLPITFK